MYDVNSISFKILWLEIRSHNESPTHVRYSDVQSDPECPRTNVFCFPGIHSVPDICTWIAQKWPRGHMASHQHWVRLLLLLLLILLQWCYIQRKRNLCINCTYSADVVDQYERARTHAMLYDVLDGIKKWSPKSWKMMNGKENQKCA